MRALFLLILVVLAAAASLAYLVRLDAGYVLIEMNRVSIETTVWVAGLVLILALLVFYYVSRLLVICADTLTRLVGRRASRQHGGWLASWRARRSNPTARGALAYAEGRWREAVRHLARGARRSDAPLLNYLLAARASEQLGDTELADGFLQLAAEVPGSAAAVRLARAQSAMRRGDYREALACIEVEALDAATEPAAFGLALDALQQLQEWPRLAALLPQARARRVRPEAQLDAMEERAHRALISAQGLRAEALQEAWHAMPRRLRARPLLLCAYASALGHAGNAEQASELLAAALRQEWLPELISAYGLLDGADPKRQLRVAEAHLREHPEDPDLLLALGRIALRAQLWGKARDYLESSLTMELRPETCVELARLCEQLGDTVRAHALLQRALTPGSGRSVMTTPALPRAPGSHR